MAQEMPSWNTSNPKDGPYMLWNLVQRVVQSHHLCALTRNTDGRCTSAAREVAATLLCLEEHSQHCRYLSTEDMQTSRQCCRFVRSYSIPRTTHTIYLSRACQVSKVRRSDPWAAMDICARQAARTFLLCLPRHAA
jgi:hypothetical protein